jgi:CRP-like cAMP-binding protein
MTRSSEAGARDTAAATENHLLGALAPADFEKIAPSLEPIALTVRLVLYEPDEKMQHVYFPTGGCVSLINVTPDGAVEVATVGREGFVGVPVLLRADSMPVRSFVQVEGNAYRMGASAFRTVVRESEGIQQLFLRYSLALFNQVAQSVVCNRLHSLESRCARWLLMTRDRLETDHFMLTQEFLAYMLGVHRPAVTIAAGILQEAGCIQYARGRITITDRAALERASCMCYQAIRANYEALVG